MKKDYIGYRKNNLTVIEEMPPKVVFRKKRNCTDLVRRVKCRCECGNIKIIDLKHLTSSHTKSCGCGCWWNSNPHSSMKYDVKNQPLYGTWNGILDRCLNKKSKHYKSYGGRGVCVCKEWQDDFFLFKEWALDNGWVKGMEVDKDIKGNGLMYSPEMCCIVTPVENKKYRRNIIHIEYEGRVVNFKELSEIVGISSVRLHERYWKGWRGERLVQPLQIRNRKCSI